MLYVHGSPNHTHKEWVKDMTTGERKKVVIQFGNDGNYKTKKYYEMQVLRKHAGHPSFWKIKKDTETDRLKEFKRKDLWDKAKELGWEQEYRYSKKSEMVKFIKSHDELFDE